MKLKIFITGDYTAIVVSRDFPKGTVHWDFEFPFKDYKDIVITPDTLYMVCYGWDKKGPQIFVHAVRNGDLKFQIPVNYEGFKEVLKVVALPDKPTVIALIDVDKGNLIDILQEKYLKSIPAWDGTCSKVFIIFILECYHFLTYFPGNK